MTTVELSEAAPAPAAWTDIPNAGPHRPGPAFLTAVVPEAKGPSRFPETAPHLLGRHDPVLRQMSDDQPVVQERI
ncbi:MULTISPECIES: hypothetical protein [unclassified Micromonospora]|uniref:hypothetical protein n=1 Tax=unclassified Micromonospora TaxID=2617518 RepID=UPI0033DAF6FA